MISEGTISVLSKSNSNLILFFLNMTCNRLSYKNSISFTFSEFVSLREFCFVAFCQTLDLQSYLQRIDFKDDLKLFNYDDPKFELNFLPLMCFFFGLFNDLAMKGRSL